MKRTTLIEYRGTRSQAEMAKKYGVAQQTWACWETGASTPPPYIMKELEDDSGIPMEEIFFDRFNRKTQLSKKVTTA